MNLQPEVLFEGIEIAIVVKKRQAAFDVGFQQSTRPRRRRISLS